MLSILMQSSCPTIITFALLVVFYTTSAFVGGSPDAANAQVPNQKIEAEQWFRQGNQQFIKREYNAALNSYQKVYGICQKLENVSCLGVTLQWMGNVYRNLEQYQQAISSYQQALILHRKIAKRLAEGQTLNNLGITYRQMGQYAKARDVFQQALVIFKQIGDRSGEGSTLINIGTIYSVMSQYPQALNFYQQALAIFQLLGQQTAYVDALSNIAQTYADLGEYSTALKLYEQALPLREKIGDMAGKGATLRNIGLIHRFLGQNLKALEFYQEALAINRRMGNRAEVAEDLNNIGFAYERMEQYAKALEVLKQSLAIVQMLGRRNSEGNILDTLATVYKGMGQYSKAMELYQQALIIEREVGNRTSERVTLSNIGDLLKRQNQPKLAIVFYKQSINLTEAIRQNLQALPRLQQESYTKTVADNYRDLADLLLSEGRILEAQQVLELLKIQEIRQFTRNATVKVQNSGIAINSTEEKILKEHGTLIAFGLKVDACRQTRCAQISQLNDQLQVLTQHYNQTVQTFEKDIRQRRSIDDALLDPKRLVPKAKEIIEAQPYTVLIYPLVLKDKIWLLWAAPGGVVKSVEVPVSQTQLGQTVLQFRQAIQDPRKPTKEVQEASQLLYNWLIKPLEKELKANHIQHLVFSLDRVTRYIPMSALFDGEKYLVERYTISTVLSADLTDMRDRLPPSAQEISVLAAGASTFQDPNFTALPNVPAELDAIVRKHPTDIQGIYPGLKFLNQAFDFRALRDNLSGHRIVHIATHAEFLPGRPDNSYLVLGTGAKLSIPEIETLQDLSNVHLVVLSACETALGGPDQDGVEISGISSYFLRMGAKAVMASLWAVNDASTSQLMQQFYRNLASATGQQRLTKAEALRQAQLALMQEDSSAIKQTRGDSFKLSATSNSEPAISRNLSHPYYWAPFVLIGNGL